MLKDQAHFDRIEKLLHENGAIARFEKESGPVKGRMMITITDIPEGIEITRQGKGKPVAFEGSFDFYDSIVGLAIYPADCIAATGIWITPQKDDAETPAQDWIEFFVKTLVSSFGEDGSYSVPVCLLVNDTADLTVIPTVPDED